MTMGLSEELERLQQLHVSGAITDDEFTAAKRKLLASEMPAVADVEMETRRWAMFIHVSQLAGFVVLGAGLILPIVLWQIKRTELPGVEVHGKMVANWIISEVIYFVVAILLSFLIIGIPLVIALIVAGMGFPILGANRAYKGEVWRYPLTITFIR